MNRPNLERSRMAGAKLLHTLTWAQHLPGYRVSERCVRAADDTIEYICWRHPNSPTAVAWSEK